MWVQDFFLEIRANKYLQMCRYLEFQILSCPPRPRSLRGLFICVEPKKCIASCFQTATTTTTSKPSLKISWKQNRGCKVHIVLWLKGRMYSRILLPLHLVKISQISSIASLFLTSRGWCTFSLPIGLLGQGPKFFIMQSKVEEVNKTKTEEEGRATLSDFTNIFRRPGLSRKQKSQKAMQSLKLKNDLTQKM